MSLVSLGPGLKSEPSPSKSALCPLDELAQLAVATPRSTAGADMLTPDFRYATSSVSLRVGQLANPLHSAGSGQGLV
jgi:hypothetical protein